MTENIITISSDAAKAVQGILTEKKLDNHALRVYVAGSSCSGTQFGIALDDKVNSNDTTIEMEGVKILVDSQSLEYMQGASIDYVNDPKQGAGFVINAPNLAQNSCGGGAQDNNSCGGCSG